MLLDLSHMHMIIGHTLYALSFAEPFADGVQYSTVHHSAETRAISIKRVFSIHIYSNRTPRPVS